MELKEAQERCLNSLVWAINELGSQITRTEVEPIAELIIQTMTGPWRYFHTPEHIFDVGGEEHPIEVLAALFHDLVYVQVDQGVSFNISSYITPFVRDVRGQLVIRDSTQLTKDLMFEIVSTVFGFSPGQTLSPFAGQNEFLSAAIAAKCLKPFLSPSVIAQIAACIEATIPFRPKLESGFSAMDMLYQRLINANKQFNFGWTDAETCEVVKRAVRLANRDVENFASTNSADFLDNTWNLLPETNHELPNANSYTVQVYRKSLQKMEGFMNFLKPELVFQQFMGEPNEETYRNMLERTRKNLEVAKLYLGSKLTTIAILEALSYRMGRDIPLSTMMGELPDINVKSAALQHFIPNIDEGYQPKNELESEVLELLAKGRNKDSPYDIKNSPVTTFIIKSIGFDSGGYLLQKAKDFFNGKIEAEEFLKECDPYAIKTVIEAVGQLFESRKMALRGIN
ncbi:hypothetical protein [Aerosakkonema funiforme]|uniref:Uncharacterized protein n=2 Tax=Oscillatoriophycideae TaxID=1301283 RepID=A0A926ZI47_9CYAN|nr:hypothetical protein [Aerosakkonema funiforme]MBD2183740.1 hypothetical protein [Aerosakkonema funiforme FACHB-1375]